MILKPVLFFFVACMSIMACDTPRKTAISVGDNSRNSIDWQGVYYGKLPCVDCPEIAAQVQLNDDLTYSVSEKHAAGDGVIQSTGKFVWDHTGGRITFLKPDKRLNTRSYIVGEHVLIPLSGKGQTADTTSDRRFSLRKDQGGVTEKYWKLTELYGQPVITPEHGREAHMILKEVGGKVHGNGGCNTYNGTYELKAGNRIRFSKMVTTMMACPDDGGVEARLHQVFEQADNYSLHGDSLTLNKARMAPLARFVAVYLR